MTGKLWLNVTNAILPTTAPATRSQVESAGAAPANGPKHNYDRLVFADAADRFAIWNPPIPPDFAPGFALSLSIWWGAAVNAGNVLWVAGVLAGELEDTDFDAVSYPTVDALAAQSVPGTVGQRRKSTLTLTTPAEAIAGNDLSVFIGRNGDGAADTAAGNAELYKALLEYTTTGA